MIKLSTWGITIDTRLNFEERVGIVAKNISRSFGVICKLRNVLPLKALLVIYYFMNHPHLLYGITIWGNTCEKYPKRLITFAYYSQLNILKLEDLYTYEVAKLMHKYSQNKLSYQRNFLPFLHL